jgi:hypothetical protein
MKSTILSAAAVLATASASNVTCTPGAFMNNTAFNADSYAEFKGEPVSECCSRCNADDKCNAWGWEPHGLLSKEKCRLFVDRANPSSDANGYIAGAAPAPPPTPPPPPTPAPPPTPGTNWVVIAAGSSTYQNYRHQADACHAYQVPDTHPSLSNGSLTALQPHHPPSTIPPTDRPQERRSGRSDHSHDGGRRGRFEIQPLPRQGIGVGFPVSARDSTG